MRKCCVCKRNIWFWNKFNNKYGEAIVFDKKTFKPLKKIRFCSMECYESVLTPEFKNKSFHRFFQKETEEWIKLKEEDLICPIDNLKCPVAELGKEINN